MNNSLTKISEIINEISMGPFGSDIKVDSFVESGVPVLNGANLPKFKLLENEFRYVTHEKAKTFRKAIAKRGDIVITHRGTLGQISYIPENSKYEEYVISQSQFRVALNRNLVDPAFFVYYFHTAEGQKRLLANKCHVGVPALAQATTNFRLIEIPLPDLSTQQKISSVLTKLDSKIELNNRINAELEAMAKTLYDYWFVQFDFPNTKGKPYKTSGGKMGWNEELKREIPDGWKVTELGEIINIYDSKRIPLSRTQREKRIGNIPYYGATSIMGYVDEYIFDDDYILLAEDGSVMDENGFPIVQFIWGKTWVNNHAHVIQAKNKINNEFIFHLVKTISVIQIMSGSIQLKINQENLRNVKVCVPKEDILNKFSTFAIPIRKKIINNIEENQQLTELRDWLLPMLMNGQVKMADVEEDILSITAEPNSLYNATQSAIPANKKGFAKQVLGGKIVSLFKDDENFTDIKFMKLQFLGECIAEADLLWNYYANVAGPYDNKYMHSISLMLKRNKWFEEKQAKYYPLQKANEIDGYYNNYFGNANDKLIKLFTLLKDATEKFCEAVATIYAVWNNHIILKQEFNKEKIQNDFFDWSKRKENVFTPDEFDKALQWMQKNQIIPKGFGYVIEKKAKK